MYSAMIGEKRQSPSLKLENYDISMSHPSCAFTILFVEKRQLGLPATKIYKYYLILYYCSVL